MRNNLHVPLASIQPHLSPEVPPPRARQTGRSGAGWERRFAKLRAHLASQESVRVRGAFGEVVIRRPTLTTDSLLPQTDTSATIGPRVGLRDVTSIQLRGGASGTGALVGAGVGFAGGLAAGVGLATSLCSGGGCSNAGGGAAVITLGSTVAGALIGALIGAPIQKWHTVYRAR